MAKYVGAIRLRDDPVNPAGERCASFVIWTTTPRAPRLVLLCLSLLLFLPRPAWSVDANKDLSQYAHSSWKTRDGVLSGSPIVIAQTTDGFLWVGTNLGLVRFAGEHFSPWSPPPGQALLDSRILSLVAARDGSLWIGTAYSVSHWKNGQLTNYPKLTGRIEAMVEGSDASVWLVRTQITDAMGPLCHIDDEGPKCYGIEDGLPFPMAIHVGGASSGALWVGGYSELCLWKPGSCRSYFAKGPRRPETFASFRVIATGRQGSLWAAVDNHVRNVLQLEHFTDAKWESQVFPKIPVGTSDVTSLFVDRDNVLWIGTTHHGIFRARGSQVDHFGKADGLSSDAVGRFYQDAEGTVWVTTSEGLDNFRDLLVTNYSMAEGLSADAANAVLAAHDGTIWMVNAEALDRLRGGRVASIRAGKGLPGRFPTTLFEDHAGRIWVGLDNNLWVYEKGFFRPVRRRDGSPLGIVFSITEDNEHDVWARAGQRLYRIHDLRVEEELASSQISTSYLLASNPRGGIYLGLVNGDLVQLQDGKTTTLASNEPGNRPQIRDLLVEEDGSVWGTTLDEVARWKDGVRRNLTTRNGLPCDGIFALVKDNQDSLWLYSRCGLIEIDKEQLEKWWQHSDASVEFTLFNTFDGVQPGLTSLKPQAVRSPDGHLWFVNGHALQEIDPVHSRKNTIPPPVNVERVLADRKEYSDQQAGAGLPALTRDLEIDYAALSFVSPQKVRFRYNLEGHDPNWIDAGTRRQAFYNDLQPGSYRFRVIACNNDGVWNEQGSTLSFNIAPAWYQTTIFRILVVIGFLALAASLYRLRIRQVARAMSARFDVRLAERTRIALEIHDTFLQTIQGSKLLADDALEDPGDTKRMHRAMEQLSKWLERATQEGRAALHSLRSSTIETNDLAQALRRATEDGFSSGKVAVDFSVVGTTREMHPIVRDEIYRIAYEAIRNAYSHSHASQLEIELRYSKDLRIRVRDNGVGIDPVILSAGKEGHYGLGGMSERAARIGGKLTVASSPGSGTEVVIQVPGGIIFRSKGDTQSSSAFKDLVDAIRRKSAD